MQMPFGKYVGQELADIPLDYLRWLLRTVHLRSDALREEAEELTGMEASAPAEEASDPWTRRASSGQRRPPSQPWAPPPPPPPSFDADGFVFDVITAVNKWRRKQAWQHHPDRGGDLRVMQAINGAGDDLLAVIQEAAERHQVSQ